MDRKKLYFLLVCICLAMGIVGATYAYFTAKAVDDSTISGNAATVTFGLKVERVTTIDMAFGLIPMRNDQAPGAAQNKCYDDLGNAGCQLYRITVSADSDTAMFLDGYVETTKKPDVETRIAAVYTDDNEQTFNTKFTPLDFVDRSTLSDEYLANNDIGDLGIKTGVRGVDDSFLEQNSIHEPYNRENDVGCFLFSNQQIGGSYGRTRVFYMMIWVYDNGLAQDVLQGMELAYRGSVTFVTAQGNEISATFD